MQRTGLISLVFLVFLCLPGYAQTDSAQRLSNTNNGIADTGKPLAPGTQEAAATPATVANPAVNTVKNQEPVKNPVAAVKPGYSIYWLTGCGLLGILLGGFGYKLLDKRFGMDKNADEALQKHNMQTSDQVDDGGFVNQWNMEQEHARLIEENNALKAENEQLKRDKDELGRLLKSTDHESGMNNEAVKEIVFYMPQPNMNGRFQEASKRTDAADALYAFHVPRDNQSSATFEFIAKDAYLNAAIGNEPSWISIACDRTNQPSGTTTRVKTESPGQAFLKDGEWEITRKAKITYL